MPRQASDHTADRRTQPNFSYRREDVVFFDPITYARICLKPTSGRGVDKSFAPNPANRARLPGKRQC